MALSGWRWAVAAWCVFLLATPAHAVIVILKGDPPTVIKGRLGRQNEFAVEIEEPLPGGERKRHSLPRAKIDLLQISVDDARLATLDPANPVGYRDYAEELAVKREDPDAWDAALRLYLIAARLDPEMLGKSCLLAMVPLARSPAEERSFRALAFLHDPAHDAEVLRPTALPPVAASGVSDDDRQVLSKLVQLVRTGEHDLARAMLRRTNVAAAVDRVAPLVTRRELEAAAQSHLPLGRDLLRRLLTLELAMTPPPAAIDTVTKSEPTTLPTPRRWVADLAARRLSPIAPLDLDYVTEFDPRQCLFRDGRWVTPDK